MEQIPQITIDESEFTRNINDDLIISQDNIDECLEQQAALYAYYSIRLQQANTLKDQAEFDFDKIMNEVINATRDELLGSGSKITDKQVMAIVNTRPEVLEARQKFITYNGNRDKLYSLVRAIEHKKDSLIALAYRKKSELEMLANKAIYSSSKIPRSGVENEN